MRVDQWRVAHALGGVFCAILLSVYGCESKRAGAPRGSSPQVMPEDAAASRAGAASADAGGHTSPNGADAAPARLEPLPDEVWRGVCLAHNWQQEGARGYGTDASAETLDHLQRLGVQWVSLTPFGWMSSLESTEISGEYERKMPAAGETSGRLSRVVAQARARNIRVMLKPHLWIRRGAWRGAIAPRADDGEDAWATWWDEYRAFILYYARFAARHDLDALVVGVELVSALRERPEEFVRTIEAVREVYDGPLTYSANWDEDVPLDVWRQLDGVGVQLYPPLTESLKARPTVGELRAALAPHMRRWSEVGEAAQKPVWLTEVGYKSAVSAVLKPYGWPERMPEDQRHPDEELQKRAYRALLAEVGEWERIQGVFIWKYFTDADTEEEGPSGFSPRGKPAEAVLRRAYGGQGLTKSKE